MTAWLCLWFTAGLAEMRSSGITDGTVLGGTIPYSDAANYLGEASRVVEGHDMTQWGMRRPLADAYFAGILYVAHGRVSLAVAFAGILTATALGIAAHELRKKIGLVAAVFWVWLILSYCRRYVGEIMSEHAGLALGALALALLIRAFSDNIKSSFFFGIFVLGLALNARAGAFFVLPLFLVLAAWQWRQSGLLRFVGLSVLSVAAAFIINSSFGKMLGPPYGKSVSNYHYVIYGIIFGGGWEKAAADIPNFNRLDESAQKEEVYRRVAKAVRANPALLWRAGDRSWSEFFGGSERALGPFSFFRQPGLERWLLGLSAAGVFWSFALCCGVSPIILAVGIGIVLSVPFLPPADADLMRAYAATMPLMMVIPAFALTGWRGWVQCFASNSKMARSNLYSSPPSGVKGVVGLYILSLGFLSILLAGPILARFVAPIGPSASISMKGTEAELTLDLDRSSWVELMPRESVTNVAGHQLSAEQFQHGIFGMFRDFYPLQGKFLDSISHPGVVLVSPGTTGFGFLVIDAKHLCSGASSIKVLGHMVLADLTYSPNFIENSIVAE